MQVPTEISRGKYLAAITAFHEALGLDPAATLVPLVLTGERIHFSVVIPNESGGKQLAWKNAGVGSLGSILTASGFIDVVDD